MNAFITSEFSYAPVVWMSHSRKQNHLKNRIHERALRVVYKDYNSSFDELLEKDNSYKIHDRNLQKLITETFKVKMNLSPEIMKEVFGIVEGPHVLRNELKLKSRKIHSVKYGIEAAYFVGAVWSSLNLLSFSSQRSKIGFLKIALANFVRLTSNESATCKFPIKYVFFFFMTVRFRKESTCPVTPGM